MGNSNQLEKDVVVLRKKEKNYDRAIMLIQYYVQLFWLVFGAFLLSESVLLGGIASVAKNGSDKWMFWGSIFGLLLCIPWWTSFKYNHAFYQLRINEAKLYEPTEGSFFTNGNKLFDGDEVLNVSIPKFVRFLRPKRAVSLLIILFIIAFSTIAVINNPWHKWTFVNRSNIEKPVVPINSLNQFQKQECYHSI